MKNADMDNAAVNSKVFFQNVLDNISAGGLFVDQSRVIRYSNLAVESIFGYSMGELIGQKTDVLYGDRRTDKHDEHEIRNRIAEYGYHVGSAKGLKKSGESIPLNLYTFTIKENSGVAIVVEGPEKTFDTGSADPMSLLQSLMDRIPDTIYFKDNKNRIIMGNRAFIDGLNLPHGEVIGKTDLDLFPREFAKDYFADDNLILNTGKPIIDKIEKTYRSDGSVQYVSTTKAPRFDKNGNVIGTIGITRDITKRMLVEEELGAYRGHLEMMVKERTKELEESRESLLKMYGIKSEFLNTVSHELRTPLTIIKEGVGVVADGITGDLNEKQKRFLGLAMDNIDRLSRMINDFLDLSKLEGKKMKFRLIKGSLNELIDKVARSYEPLIKKNGIKFNKKLDPFLPLIMFDPDRITQVLYNMITNAIKFTEKGSVTVGSKREGKYVKITVEDTGRGIEKKDMSRLFEKFEQINPEDGSKNKGTGLGLAITKQIIEQLGGEVWAESRYGKGSRFIFTLPIRHRIRGRTC